MAKPYRRFNAQHAAGAWAKKVFICSNLECEAQYVGIKGEDNRWRNPVSQCQACSGIEFFRIDSKTEAARYAQLRMLEKRGVIYDLKRQQEHEIFGWSPKFGKAFVGRYRSDHTYRYREDNENFAAGELVIEDTKPKRGVDDVADLKMKLMAANGQPVTVHSA